MAENAHYQQLGTFVVLFQSLESSLVEIISVVSDKDCAVETLPAETKYRRLVGSAEIIVSHFVDLLRGPDLEAKTRFHLLMKRCLDIGLLRNRLVHSRYAILSTAGNAFAPVNEKSTAKFSGGSGKQVIAQDPSVESFEPYLKKIAEVLAELEAFRLQVAEWKNADGSAIDKAGKP